MRTRTSTATYRMSSCSQSLTRERQAQLYRTFQQLFPMMSLKQYRINFPRVYILYQLSLICMQFERKLKVEKMRGKKTLITPYAIYQRFGSGHYLWTNGSPTLKNAAKRMAGELRSKILPKVVGPFRTTNKTSHKNYNERNMNTESNLNWLSDPSFTTVNCFPFHH